MSEIYLLKNQDHAYLDKSNLWINSGERRQLYRTPHKDEALNMRVEWAVKHPELRIEITKVTLDEKGLPEIDLPRSPKIAANDTDTPLLDGLPEGSSPQNEAAQNEPLAALWEGNSEPELDSNSELEPQLTPAEVSTTPELINDSEATLSETSETIPQMTISVDRELTALSRELNEQEQTSESVDSDIVQPHELSNV